MNRRDFITGAAALAAFASLGKDALASLVPRKSPKKLEAPDWGTHQVGMAAGLGL